MNPSCTFSSTTTVLFLSLALLALFSSLSLLPLRVLLFDYWLQKPKTRGGSGVANLWRKPELRWRSMVSCIIWSAFGFMYYGVILLSSKIMGDSDECSFDYSILFFAASRCCVLSIKMVSLKQVDLFPIVSSSPTASTCAPMSVVSAPFRSNIHSCLRSGIALRVDPCRYTLTQRVWVCDATATAVQYLGCVPPRGSPKSPGT